ncbi:sigma-54-dependent transcriptional regulator [Veronia pacifica]|uniref:C4-dicarboxylate ABC transporter n=1 Tax=Veronia pacifica TaxID=1080227 RepID=A0A1C3ESU1_9GAMM|nr:sigma-54 dependent transcriptional regulator [Veronia pacifica]ODA36245.1 C4-dicarboxylate ABC transporter [Veronia pacifica]
MRDVYFIDDETDLRHAYQQTFELEDIDAAFFSSAEEALLAIKEQGLPLVVVSDIRLPGLSGIDLCRTVIHRNPDLPVVLITGHGDIATAVDAMKDGAYDFIEKPFSSKRLIDTIRRAIEKQKLIRENEALRRKLKASQVLGPRIIGTNEDIVALKETISQIADTQTDVLILGETGTGKELVARSLHEHSTRNAHPFVAINCGAVPENLIESELFGHEKGAFTGADSLRVGKFEHANKGTLFLDEIESMPMQAQIRLLRVLQERTVERIGSNTSRPIDIRVIAATKTDLFEASEQRQFRQDLYYRLNVVTLSLPPLRARKDDIPALFHHFLLIASDRHGKATPTLDSQSLNHLMQHDWPGNIRELRNAAERFVLFRKLDPLTNEREKAETVALADKVAEFERAAIEQALIENGGSIKHTMQMLQLARKTLYDKMQRYGLDKEDYKNADL